ncbi:MAG: phosphoenolpyruvate--protein phosphotransferase [Desulfatiglans sp.]|jgi:phosphotransferase system enzyme I (PtsI)|nr:phosphoenolpyruvate--protein phosphotransferase [Thermodesulfobacteriota bacterium]MEE4352049.1 phosphoenolpyruvate--protein phosphotransferase [Desulfatiglans sp.]
MSIDDEPIRLRGIGVSPGIVIGKASLVDRGSVKIFYQYLSNNHIAKEVERFEEALQITEDQFIALKNRMPDDITQHGFILDSFLMILRDSMLADATVRRIVEERINAEWALEKSLQGIREVFEKIDDEYIGTRIHDVENVAERILRNLMGELPQSLAEIDKRVIIVAQDLSPADTAELNLAKVMGFITDLGGRTSHTAILAQALEIPVVAGLESVTHLTKEGDLLIVDGNTGDVIINPDEEDIVFYQDRQVEFEEYKSSIARESHLPAVTQDGRSISVKANIEFLEEVAAARRFDVSGIGLYRTEFLYLRSKGLPSEEELFENYKEVAELVAPDPVNIRTFDLGGDKLVSGLEMTRETNPALGVRGIRFCLKELGIFKSQLRAILRASAFGSVQLMFPMISGVQEILDAKEIVEEEKRLLDKEGVAYDHDIKVGVLIEIPSAVTMADALADHVDFFSIGTNDLIQYALAIDRVNEDMAFMYQPFHPAILRMIRYVVDAAKRAGIGVSVCGEMAGDPLCISMLLGLGIDELSMNPGAIPLCKKVIRSVTIKEAMADAEEVMRLRTAKEVREFVVDRIKHLVPELEKTGSLDS